MWWSQGIGGASALDYLVKVRGDPFTRAMEKILGRETDRSPFLVGRSADPQPHAKAGRAAELSNPARDAFAEKAAALPHEDRTVERKPGRLLLPPRSGTSREITKYLMARGIDREIIERCIREGLLYESLPYHNCVFVGRDVSGEARYDSYRACKSQKIMGEAAGSDKTYAFHIDGEEGNHTLHVFESAIDLLSFATIMKQKGTGWRAESMLSLGGIYAPGAKGKWKTPSALTYQLEKQDQIRDIALHLDNDHAGRAAAARLILQLNADYRVRDEPPIGGKDVNEELQYLIRNCQQKRKERDEYVR